MINSFIIRPLAMALILTMAVLMLSACSWFSGNADEENASDTAVELVITSGEQINPTDESQANPVMINIYQLKQKAPFIDLDALSLFQKDAQILAKSLINKQTLAPLLPAEKRKITLMIHPETRAIGVFAEFERYSESKGIALVLLDKEEEISHLEISVDMLSVNINKVVDNSLWNKFKGSFSWFQ